MKKIACLFVVILCLVFSGCEDGRIPIQGETEWQVQQNAIMKDASRSPLTEEDRQAFKGLDFFKYNSDFEVMAYMERTPDSDYFNMSTTTGEFSKERIYGILHFQLNGKDYELNLYQGEENLNTPGFENYLFLPFLDDTNGFESYGGGRYLDLRIPEADSIAINFNKAYNPYCVYNENFSCPITPRQNYLDLRVEAGMKKFKKN